MKVGVLTLAVSLMLVAAAAAGPGVDQQQLLVGTQSGAVGGAYDGKLAQTFTPAVAGLLTEIRVAADCADAQPIRLEVRPVVYDFAPPGVVFPGFGEPVATVDFQAVVGEERYQTRSVALTPPPFLPAGAPAVFILSSGGRCSAPVAPIGDLYTRGHVFFDERPNQPGRWYLISASPGFGDDLVFSTIVEPACQVPAVAKLPTSNAAAAIVRYGCSAGRISRAYSSRVPRGRVITTSPTIGTQLAPGTAVRLVVSDGPKPKPKPKHS